MNQVPSNETHLSAQQNKACPQPWFSRPDGHQGRTPDPEASSRERACTADTVTRAAPLTAAIIKLRETSSPAKGFGRSGRLLTAKAFGRVFRRPTRSRDGLFTVLYRENQQDKARLGLAVSKKHSRKATARNRIKRIVRESFRQHQAQLSGLDVVVMSQPSTEAASNRELFDSLAAHWRRCGGKRARQDNE